MLAAHELAEVYLRFGYLVRRRCRALVEQDSDADDALQEVFLRVQRYGLPDDPRTTLGWLYRIAENVAFDQRTRRREAPGGDDLVKRLDARLTPQSDESDRRAVVGGVLRALDGRTREMVVRHHLDGFTQEEVAEQMKTSRRTVGKRLAVFEERLRVAWRGKELP